jgi:hypothetical protein
VSELRSTATDAASESSVPDWLDGTREVDVTDLFSQLSMSEKLSCVMGGYFADDLLRLLRTREYVFMFHHVIGVLLPVGTIKYSPPALFPYLGLLELSTIFLNVTQLLENAPKSRTRSLLRRSSAVLFLTTFVAMRLVYYPLLLNSPIAQRLRRRSMVSYSLAVVTWFLQIYWGKQILQTVVRRSLNSD